MKDCVEEEGGIPLSPSSTGVASVRDEVDSHYCFFIITLVWLKLYGCRRQCVPGDINEPACCGQVETVVHEHANAVCLFVV